MKVILKMKGQEQYVTGPSEWMADLTQAKDFKSFTDLLGYRRKHEIENVEALCSFGNSEYNFIVSVT